MPETEYWNPYVGDDCAAGAPYGGQPNCGYDLAGKYLNYIIPDFEQREKIIDYNDAGQFYAFDQTPFAPSPEFKLFDHGFIYVPNGCGNGKECPTHVFLHGCG